MKYTIKDMPKTKFAKLLVDLAACGAAKRYCKGKTLKEAWSKTRRGNWMEQYRDILENIYYSNEFDEIVDYAKRCAARAKVIREVIKVV